MDYWFWDRFAVFVCRGFLAWFDNRGRVIGPDGRRLRQPLDEYLTSGPWLAGVPPQVVAELTAAVEAQLAGAPRPQASTGPNPYRPPADGCQEWEYYARCGVRLEGDHLLWYEREGEVRFASGAACEQTFADFVTNGPHLEDVPAETAAAVAALVCKKMQESSA